MSQEETVNVFDISNRKDYNSVPPFEKSEENLQLSGWWSQTGKKEPEEAMHQVEALHLQRNGKYFFRNKNFSARGVFYFGKWRPVEDTNQIKLHNEILNNMKIEKTEYFTGTGTILDGGDIKLEFDGKTYEIPKVLGKRSRKKSARK